MNNITLIGMPSVGKSTVGKRLASLTCRRFVDTDRILIQTYRCTLKELIKRLGTEGFIRAENRVLVELDVQNAVIATGGSAVYGEKGMARLKTISTIVYLAADPATLEKRLGDPIERGVVARAARTVAELYAERSPLFDRWADVKVEVGQSVRETTDRVLAVLGEKQ